MFELGIEKKLISLEVLQKTKLSNFKLVVAGSDKIEGKLTREVFNLLKNDGMNIIISLCDDEEMFYFYKQSIKKTIIFIPRSITPGRKRSFFLVFDSFHMRSITASFCRTVYG
jgi:hypothetical protein